MGAAGWVWTAACQRSWSAPPPTAQKLPCQRCAQRMRHRDQTAATAIEVVVTQEERIATPQGCRGPVGPPPPSGRQCSAAFPAPVSGELVKTPYRIVIENLNVAGMLASHRLARAISDAGWAEFARLLKYKQAWRGGHLVEADRWYPSTRLCPHCGQSTVQ